MEGSPLSTTGLMETVAGLLRRSEDPKTNVQDQRGLNGYESFEEKRLRQGDLFQGFDNYVQRY